MPGKNLITNTIFNLKTTKVMRRLNKTASKTFRNLIKMAEENDSQVTIGTPGEAFMPVCVEILETEVSFGTGLDFWKRVSVAHYGEQNGDLMADPEMEFMYKEDSEGLAIVFPLSIKNSYQGKFTEAIFRDTEGRWQISDIPEQHDQAVFASIWMQNIKMQQGERIKKY